MMDIETKGLGAGSYPEPKEIETREVYIRLDLEYKILAEIPKYWEYEEIEEDIKQNIREYISNGELTEMEVTVNAY